MISAFNLKTEYLHNPIGIDIRKPRLFWNALDAVMQTAYQIIAYHSDGRLVWDSGKVLTDDMYATYNGVPLQSRDHIIWQIMLWDENDRRGESSEPVWFEMGLLKADDWQANWLTADLTIDKKNRYPADYFRKRFDLCYAVAKARLYITACGLYDAQINGYPVTKNMFMPGYTDYRKRIQYQTYDVTELLKSENTLDITVADGWYRGNVNLGGPRKRYIYGVETAVKAQLEIFYENGESTVLCTDDSFLWSNDGAVRYADLKNGEIFDSNRTPSYAGKSRLWECATPLVASNNVCSQPNEQFDAATVISPSGKRIFDFGQNIAGIIHIKYRGAKGQVLTIRLGEVLYHGEFTQSNFQMAHIEAKQTVEILCCGEEIHYTMTFSFAGFRYVYVEEQPEDFTHENISATAVYSDMELTGDFKCSNQSINQLVRNTLWSMKNNFLDVPTDCPTREKSPWTGDAQVFCKTSCYFMNTATFYRKWLKDIADRQTEEGLVHFIVPDPGAEGIASHLNGSVGWADAAIIIPYTCWKMYGDRQVLVDNYGMMKKYALFVIKRAGENSFFSFFKKNPYKKYTYDTHHHYGEWLEPKGIEDGETLLSLLFPRPEEATAYLHLDMTLMTEMAAELGCNADEELFREYAEGSKAAYNYLFIKDDDIKTRRQCKFVRPLAFGLLDGIAKQKAQRKLVELVRDTGYTIGTGFLSTPYILATLIAAGETDAAFRLLENENCPGWLYPVKHGATTIWESWEGYDKKGRPKESHDHYSLGAVCGWLFDTVGGIQIAGKNRFLIAPHCGGSLTYAETSYQSVYGLISTRWELIDGTFLLHLRIPANCTARVILPDGQKMELVAGAHEVKCGI